MAGRVKVGTAYIDIKLGSFQEFKAEAERRAKEVGKRVADRMTEEISKKVSGTQAGQKIASEAADGVQKTLPRVGSRIKSAFTNLMSTTGGEASKTFIRSLGLGMRSLAAGDFKFFSAAMRTAGTAGAVALGEGITGAKQKLGALFQSIGSNAGSFIQRGLNAAISGVQGAVSNFGSKIGSSLASGFKNIPSMISSASASLGTFARNLGLTSFMAQNLGYELTFLATVPVVAVLGAFGKIGLTAGLNLEQARASLAPFVGGIQNARKEIEELSKIAEKSPAFDTTQIIQYAKQLLAAGLTQQKTNDLFKATSNIFTTYGLTVDQANLSFRAITQIMQKGKVTSEEVTQQLGEQIPAWNLLAQGMGITVAQAQELAKAGKITGVDFVNAMIKVGNTKQFIEGAGTSADTLKSKLQNLKEQVQNKLAVAFDKYLFPKLNDLADRYGPKVIKVFEKLGNTWLPRVADWIGKTADKIQNLKDKWDALSPSVQKFIEKILLGLVAAGPTVLLLSKLSSGLAGLASIASFMLTPVGLVVAAIGALGYVLYKNRDSIKAFFTETDSGKEILKNVKSALEDFTKFLDEKVKPIFRDLKNFAEDAWKGFAKANNLRSTSKGNNQAGGMGHTKDVDAAMQPVPSPVQSSFAQFRVLIDSISTTFFKSLKPALESLDKAFDNLGLKTSFANGKLGGLVSILKVVGAVIGTVIAIQVAIVSGAINLFVGLFQVVTDFVGGFMRIMKGFFLLLKGLWNGNWQEIKDGLRSIWDGIYMVTVGAIWDLIMAVVNAVEGFVKVIVGWFSWLYDVLVGHSIVPDMVNAIIKWFLSLPGKVLGALGGFVASVVGKFIDMATAAVDAVRNMAGRVADKVGEIRTAVINKAKDFAGALINAGKDLVNGLISGLGDKAGELVGKAEALANKVKSAFSNIFKFGSPSKVTRQMGRWIAQGLGLGVQDDTDMVMKAANYLGKAAVPNIPQVSPASPGLGANTMGASQTQNIEVNVNVPAPVTDPSGIADYTVRKLNTALATRGV